MSKNKIITLMGPTGTGKTDLVIQLVQKFPLEIVSVDSALVYQDMNIGTAKPSAEILKKIPHHLINILSPEKNYSVAQFLRDAKTAIDEIQAKGKMPLLVGGTMLYFKAFVEGLADIPPVSEIIRQQLKTIADQEGLGKSYARLQSVDPTTAVRVHPRDTQRILRALEVFETTGKPLSVWIQEGQQNLQVGPVLQLSLLSEDRAKLHEVLATRFDRMLAEGLVDEVQTLQKKYHLHPELSSMRSVGYRQVWEYLAGEEDEASMREKAIAASRQLAKRQMTWLRAWQGANMIFAYKPDTMWRIEQQVSQFISEN